MIVIPLAHVGGIPIEETVALYGPALLLVAGAASVRLGAWVRFLRGRRRATRKRRPFSVTGAGDGATG